MQRAVRRACRGRRSPGRFLDSGAGRAHLVEGLTERFLHRPAGPAGPLALFRRLRRGATYQDVVATLLASPEYLAQG
jgi:hypothetical protein